MFDPNLDSDADLLEEDSPYPEVRSAVGNYDDPDMPSSTLRAWFLGIIMAIIIPGMNQFFHFRYPSVQVGGLVAQLIVFPIGRLWARFAPSVRIFGLSLNPGPFTIKEHVLVTIMATVGAQSAYATDLIAVQRVYYNQNFSFAYQWMLVTSTQLIGFSMGGIVRRFLVAPPSMIWPNTLVSCALFNTLHSQTYAGIGRHEGISRERFFVIFFVGAIVWNIFPGYLFQALSTFTWACWIAPNNVKVNQLFGYRTGLGFSLLSFDWSQIAFIGSPLATPWWSEANIMIGFVFFYWFLTPVLYYSHVWYSEYLPISSAQIFDNTGTRYDIWRIIKPDQVVATLDIEHYKAYSPLFLSASFVMTYALSFLSISATITHTIIYLWKPIKVHFRRSMTEQPDVHARLMSRYRQVPEWYYACIFAVTFIFACLCVELYDTGMTIWALLLALAIAFLYVIPIGMIQAVTNRQVGLNVITELVIGYILPHQPVAMMIFKTFGYITMTQAMQFTADFKLGHYMKVPPRSMFFAQVVASVIAGTVQLGVQSWMFSNIPDMCDENQSSGFICRGTHVFASASIFWGLVGPALQFGSGRVYYILSFMFLIGAVCPFLLRIVTRRYPGSKLSYLNFPVIFTGAQEIPVATAANFVPWAIIGFIFQYIIRRKRFSWWAKYNYVLSASLDAGTAIGVILIYFCLQYPGVGIDTVCEWWGNKVFQQTLDWNQTAFHKMPTGQPFGPTEW